ncbi:MAG: hypothetical protein J6A04_04500 [Clostridia bacterium]|nr:hypothetical protein [Clostridia bacterium]
MDERKSWTKKVILILVVSLIILIASFVIGKIIEPKLQIQHGTIIDAELESVYEPDGSMIEYFIYQIQDDKTSEISCVRVENILFPYNLFLGFLPIKNVIYSTYKNAALYTITIGGKFVGILGILVSGLCLVRNPYKKEEL